jgi:hypothetical protein
MGFANISSFVENTSMLTFATPSIATQRLAVAAFLASLVTLTWWQGAGDLEPRVRKFLPAPLPAEVREFDFSHAEASWSQLTIGSAGNFLIDSMTEPALSEATDIIRSQGTGATLSRLGFLLEKQFGDVAGRQLMELLPRLAAYKNAEQQWWAENADKTLPRYEELFALQDDFLGKTVAQQMFSDQRRVMTLMLESQRIRNDPTLTEAEKALSLQKLQTPTPPGSTLGE